MAATFFQSVMEGERRRVSPKLSQALSPNDLGDSFGARIYRDAKTRAIFPSRYIGKAKLAQFSRPDISGKQNSRNFPVPIYRDGKSRAVFSSRYIGKPKLTQFSVIGIFALKPLTDTAGMPLGTITGGKDRNNRGRCEH